ncbi:SKP1-like protein 1B [Senna tora]|uniref:SKP1-like protein n=1 Tax=Senna tora TaxID=362788 RepID=A0A834T5I1_9FABA|nr:SKP1-like protein 1B [Senna tora]
MTREIINLQSSDYDTFEVDIAVAMKSELLKRMILSGFANLNVTLRIPGVNSKMMAMVMKYCKKHADHEASARRGNRSPRDVEAIEEWDAEFIKADFYVVLELIRAARFLEIEGLLDLACKSVTLQYLVKDSKGVPVVRGTFNDDDVASSKNDFILEEEEEIRKRMALSHTP